jgi:hypothetical protein
LVGQNASAQVEASLDGQNWQTVAGVAASADWITATVDLSAYHGQTIWLRFTWLAPIPTQSGEVAAVWRLDDVQFAEGPAPATSEPPTLTATPTIAPTETATQTSIPTLTPAAVPPTETAQPTLTPTLSPTLTEIPTPPPDTISPTETPLP